MSQDPIDGNGHASPDLMERLMQTFHNEHMKLQNGLFSVLQSQVQITNQIGKLTGAIERVVGILEDITNVQRRTEEEVGELRNLVKELGDAQKHTDEGMNTLIALVDGVVRRLPTQ